jgi:hypothetical protein
MSEALDRLKNIGAQKIYEDTHIPVEHVQAILYESFDGLSKVQFIGFISILEREYGDDLSEMRSHGIAYFDEKSVPDEAITDDSIFKPSSNKKNRTVFYIIFAIILFSVAVFYSMQSANKTLHTAIKENKIIKEVKNNIVLDKNISDANRTLQTVVDTKDINTTETVEKQKVDEVQVAAPKSFKIIAKTKVWLGYIDVATNKKYQKTFKGELDLDPTKEWLLFFGHGYIDIIINGEKEQFNEKKTLRMLYKDGNISKISLQKFKELNRGNKW